jgi:thymidylate kinase
MMCEKRKQLSQIEILFIILAIRSHYHDKVLSDLLREKDAIVLMDRYIDSTFAYNFSEEFKYTCEYMNMSPKTMFNMLHHITTHGDYIKPDRTYFLDIDVDVGYTYAYNRDGYALYTKEQLKNIRERYIYLANQNKERIVTIDSNRPLQNVKMDVVKDFDNWHKDLFKGLDILKG